MKSYKEVSYRYLKKQKKKTILTIVGIIISMALITSIATMFMSIRSTLIRQIIGYTGDYHAKFLKVDGNKINKIKNNVNIEKSYITSNENDVFISKVSDREKKVRFSNRSYRCMTVDAYDSEALKELPINLKEGRFPKNSNEIIVDYWVLDYLPNKPKLGDKVKLNFGVRMDKDTKEILEPGTSTEGDIFCKKGERELKIVGLIKPEAEYSDAEVSCGITFINNKSLDMNKKYNVYVKMKSLKNVYKNINEISTNLKLKKVKNESGELVKPIKFNNSLLELYANSPNSQQNKNLILIMIFLITLVIISTIAVIYNAFNISILERVSQFGILRCTGASQSQIRRIVIKESSIISAISIPVGILLGIVATKAMIYLINLFKFSSLTNNKLVISPIVLIISGLLGVITVYLSAIIPSVKAGRVPPLNAVKNSGSLKKENLKKVKNLRVTKFLFGIEGQMAHKNLRRNRKRFRITIFSMVISITLYIVFTSLISWVVKLDVLRADNNSDLIVYMNRDNGKGFSNSIYNEIKNIKGVESVFKSMSNGVDMNIPKDLVTSKFKEAFPENLSEIVKVKGKDVFKTIDNQFLCYGEDGLKEAKKCLIKGKIDKDVLNKENGVLIVETTKEYSEKIKKTVMVNTTKYKVGDEITIHPITENSKSKKVKIIGILSRDISENNQYMQRELLRFITTEKVYKNIFGNNYYRYVSIKLKDNSNKEPLKKYLENLNSKDPRYTYIDYIDEARKRRQEVNVVRVLLYGFVAMITLISSLNIINTISTNLMLRNKEFAMLKAVGMTKGEIKKMVCLESAFYGIKAAVYGGIIGTGISYLLYRRLIDVREFDWVIPWNFIMQGTVGAIIIELISGYIPFKRVEKQSIIENIRNED